MTLFTHGAGTGARRAVWGYEDLALFLGAVLPSLGLAGAALCGADGCSRPPRFRVMP